MSALNRLKTLAAVLTLLLFVTTTALAGVPGKPIDRSEGPPGPNPTEVGEPDGGHAILQSYLRRLFAAALLGNPYLGQLVLPTLRVPPRSPAKLRPQLARGGSR